MQSVTKQTTSTPKQTLAERRQSKMTLAHRNPALANKINQMRLTIAPIVHIHTGEPASPFPLTMLQLFLLNEPQLDAMAAYYSQTSTSPSPTSLKFAYPQTMDWNRPCLSNDPSLPENCKLSDLERLRVKMRMFARFIGMRGAETPRWEYERQVEILACKIERTVREEARVEARKFYSGRNAWPS